MWLRAVDTKREPTHIKRRRQRRNRMRREEEMRPKENVENQAEEKGEGDDVWRYKNIKRTMKRSEEEEKSSCGGARPRKEATKGKRKKSRGGDSKCGDEPKTNRSNYVSPIATGPHKAGRSHPRLTHHATAAPPALSPSRTP